MDAAIRSAVDAWLNDPVIADEDQREVRDLLDAGDDTELTDRFYRELEFGTGGMRGIIGAGRNRMNVYTLGAAAQGLADYVAKQGSAAKQAGVAIACDCRRMSDAFAARTAAVMAGNGITAYLFEKLRPTPELSFAIRHLGCTAGVVITASHNPPQYNGFKVYWTDGGQITPPHDGNIIEQVRAVGDFGHIRAMDFDEARKRGLIRIIVREVDEAFLKCVDETCLCPEVCREQGRRLKIVFTALHGTGGVLIPEALRRRGFERVIEVPEQAVYDGEFSTVESPNPEEGAALKMGIDLARQEGADLVIGTDPDADRVGMAVRRADGEFELVSGNRIGALLCDYICAQLIRTNRFPDDAVVLSTIVSSDLMKEVARSYGASVVETLTGFKWIGRKLHDYDTAGTPDRPSKQFVFGAEESYGYLPARFARDKDAVTSTAFIAEAAAWATGRGQSLLEVLDDLFSRFGYYHEGAKSIVLPGKAGAEKIEALMSTLRSNPPTTIGGLKIATLTDIDTGQTRDLATGRVSPPPADYDLPPANVLIFTLADGGKVIARPSGTEPKIKFYILLKEPADDLHQARRTAVAKTDAIVAELVALAG
ncbi:MAG: phospho-sugar mutase [bacterium]|nr:phospho-sugar mutase [bacterium]